MFPEHVTQVLQQLSYVSMVISGPCIVYLTLKLIILETKFSGHVTADLLAHTMIYEHLGKHDSNIHDLQMDNAARNGHIKI